MAISSSHYGNLGKTRNIEKKISRWGADMCFKGSLTSVAISTSGEEIHFPVWRLMSYEVSYKVNYKWGNYRFFDIHNCK